jgi:hypothetical protein
MSDLSLVTQLAEVAQPWADLYNDSGALQAAVMFSHLAGLLLSGGAAVAIDRSTIAVARRTPDERLAYLTTLHASHRLIVTGLGVTLVSGLLLLGGDVEVLLTTPAFWVKMVLLGLLLANGGLLLRAEAQAASPPAMHAPPPGTAPGAAAAAWRRLTTFSYVSLSLWFALVLASTVLVTSA